MLGVQQPERGRTRNVVGVSRNIHQAGGAKRKLGANEFGRFSNASTQNLGFQQKLLPATNQRTYNNILPTFIASIPESLRNIQAPRPMMAAPATTNEFATPIHHAKKVQKFEKKFLCRENKNFISTVLNILFYKLFRLYYKI